MPLIFECNYVRFSLDTAHKYDNCHYDNCIVFQCFHTLWMTRATSVIDDCINELKIRGKRKVKRAKTRKRGHGGKHIRPKEWSGARRHAGPATTALALYVNWRNAQV